MTMKYLICNLKANKTKEELIQYERELSSITRSSSIELVICPSTPFFYLFNHNNYTLGSQDVSKFSFGPYTGESTASQLESLGVKYTLIGHSERRTYLLEDETTIIEKIKKTCDTSIRPIYFIGESKEQKDKNQTFQVLDQQISRILNEVPEHKRKNIFIVYEPIWSIGTGKRLNNDEITMITLFIKNLIKNYYNIELPILYGGSVNETNIDELSSIKEIDGLILGESSKNISCVKEIYNKYQKNI